jgi:hypothetical protein
LQHREEVSRASTAPSISSGEEEEGRLESSGGAELWVMDVELELLQNKTNQGHEKVRRAKVEEMGKRGRSRAHGRRRIRADALIDMADSGQRFVPPRGILGEREKGARGRRWRGFYRPGLDGHLVREINGGVTPATVSKTEIEGGNSWEDDGADRWVLGVSG